MSLGAGDDGVEPPHTGSKPATLNHYVNPPYARHINTILPLYQLSYSPHMGEEVRIELTTNRLTLCRQ